MVKNLTIVDGGSNVTIHSLYLLAHSGSTELVFVWFQDEAAVRRVFPDAKYTDGVTFALIPGSIAPADFVKIDVAVNGDIIITSDKEVKPAKAFTIVLGRGQYDVVRKKLSHLVDMPKDYKPTV